MQIILQPISFQLGKDTISTLKKVLSEEFKSSVVSTASPIKELPLQLYEKQRNQWKSNEVLQWLLDNHRANTATITTTRTTKILAICDFDAYSSHLNFVFGKAYLDGSISAIYLPRLRQEFYGLKADEYL